jgi:hypothetical protein
MEQAAAQETVFEQPCTLKGVQSALAAGGFGYVLGFVPAVFRFKARSWGLIHKEGWKSAQTIALMSGLYATVSCITTRIRQKEDNVTRGISGCATGLALGWSGGPWSAMQSCAGLGMLSYIFDFGGPTSEGAAKAATACCAGEAAAGEAPSVCTACCQPLGSLSLSSRGGGGGGALPVGRRLQQRLTRRGGHAAEQHALQLPPVMWLATVANGSYFA